jgi:hypothetical protein
MEKYNEGLACAVWSVKTSVRVDSLFLDEGIGVLDEKIWTQCSKHGRPVTM